MSGSSVHRSFPIFAVQSHEPVECRNLTPIIVSLLLCVVDILPCFLLWFFSSYLGELHVSKNVAQIVGTNKYITWLSNMKSRKIYRFIVFEHMCFFFFFLFRLLRLLRISFYFAFVEFLLARLSVQFYLYYVSPVTFATSAAHQLLW